MTENLAQWGRYRSDALQVKVEKRLLGGANTGVFTWVLSYTFAKAFEQNHRLQNWNPDEPAIYELDNTDKRHMLSFSGVWDLPVGRNKRFVNFDNRAAYAGERLAVRLDLHVHLRLSDRMAGSRRQRTLPDNQQNWPRLVQLSAKFFF